MCLFYGLEDVGGNSEAAVVEYAGGELSNCYF